MRRNYFYITKKKLKTKRDSTCLHSNLKMKAGETSSGHAFLQTYPSAAGYINFPGKV